MALPPDQPWGRGLNQNPRDRLSEERRRLREQLQGGPQTRSAQPSSQGPVQRESLNQERARLRENLSATRGSPRSTPSPEDEPWQSEGFLGDTAIGLARGAAHLPEIATGIGDIGAGFLGFDRPFSRGASAIGKATGFQPSEFREDLADRFSPQMQEAQQAVDESSERASEQFEQGDFLQGAGTLVGGYLQNPRSIQSLVTESLPATAAGGLLGRGAVALAGTRQVAGQLPRHSGAFTPATTQAQQASRLAPATSRTLTQNRLSGTAAGAVGEVPIIAGATMSEIDEDVDPLQAAAISTGVGIGGGLLAGGGAALARRAGLSDIETALAGGNQSRTFRTPTTPLPAKRNIVSRVTGGAVAEGVLQEMPQEALEQMGVNFAEGENLFEGVPRAAVEGMLAGGAMGAGVNLPGPIRARGANEPRNLTAETPPAPEDGEGGTGTGTADSDATGIQRLPEEQLFDDYQRARVVAEQARDQHPDMADLSLRHMSAIQQELDRRGIPREAVEEAQAAREYQRLVQQQKAMGARYQETVTADPEKARNLLPKMRKNQQRMKQLTDRYTEEQLFPRIVQEQEAVLDRAEEIDPSPKYRNKDRRPSKATKEVMEPLQGLENSELASVLQRSRNQPSRYGPRRVAIIEALAERRGVTVEDALGETGTTEPTDTGRIAGQLPAPTPTNVQGRDVTANDDSVIWNNVTEGDAETIAWDALSPTQQEAFSGLVAQGSDQDVETLTQQARLLSAQSLAQQVFGDVTPDEVLQDVLSNAPRSRENVLAFREALRNGSQAPLNDAAANRGVSRQAIRSSLTRLRQRFNDRMDQVLGENAPTQQQRMAIASLALDPDQTMASAMTDPFTQEWFNASDATEQAGATVQDDAGIVDSDAGMGTVASAEGSGARDAGAGTPGITPQEPVTAEEQAETARRAGEANEGRTQRTLGNEQAVSAAEQELERISADDTLWAEMGNAPPTWQELSQDRLAAATWIEAVQAAQTAVRNGLNQRDATAALARLLDQLVSEGLEADSADAEGSNLQEAVNDAAEQPTDRPDGVSTEGTPEADDRIVAAEQEAGRKVQIAEAAAETINGVDFSSPTQRGRNNAFVNQVRTDVDALRALQESIRARNIENIEGVTTLEEAIQKLTEDADRLEAAITEYFTAHNNRLSLRRRADTATGPEALPLEEVQRIADEITNNWRITPTVQVVSTEANLPPEVRSSIVEENAAGVANGAIISRDLPDGSRTFDVYIVADRMHSRKAIEKVLLHEIHGHFGLRLLLGAEMNPVLDQIFRARRNSQAMQDIIRLYFPDGFDPTNVEHTRTAAEEMLAVLAADGTSPSLLNRIVAAINRGLRRLGWTTRIDRSDLIILMHRASQAVTRGSIDVGPLDGGEVRFMMAGENSDTLDRSTLEKAIDRLQELGDLGEATREQVRRETGFYLGPDDQWRYEISDRDAVIHTGAMAPQGPFGTVLGLTELELDDLRDWGELSTDPVAPEHIYVEVPLGRIMEHETLFAAYPGLSEIKVRLRPARGVAQNGMPNAEFGVADSLGSNITVGYDVDAGAASPSVLLHEVQHIVQDMEGFARGGSPEMFVYNERQDLRDAWQQYKLRVLAHRVNGFVRMHLFPGETEISTMSVRNQLGLVAHRLDTTERKVEAALMALASEDYQPYVLLPDRTLRSQEDSYKDREEAKERLSKASEAFLGAESTAYDKYLRLYGEMEARNTEARMTLSDEQRRATDILQTVPGRRGRPGTIGTDEVIVYFRGSPLPEYAPKPVFVDALERAPKLTKAMASRSPHTGNAEYETKKSNFMLAYEDLAQRAPESFNNARKTTRNLIRKYVQPGMFTHDLVDFIAPLFVRKEGGESIVRQYDRNVRRQQAERQSRLARLQHVVDHAKNLSHTERTQFNEYLRQSTIREAWGFQPRWLDRQVDIDPELARMWDQLGAMRHGAEMQQMAQGMFKEAQNMHSEMVTMAQAEVRRTFERMIANAKTEATKEKHRKAMEKQLADLSKQARSTREAYLPLRRWGSYVLMYRSDAFKQAKKEGRDADVRKMKQDPNHYQVYFAETDFSARQIKTSLEKETGKKFDEPFHRMEISSETDLVSYDLLQKLQSEANVTDNAKTNQQVKDAINKLYIRLLSDNTAKKAELERLRVEGGGTDMIRGFVDHGSSMAAVISSLKLNRDTRETLQEMQQMARDPDAPRRNDRVMAYNELALRHAQLLDYQESPLQNKIMAGTSIWMLLTNPAYYIQNSTQPWMLTFPWLASRYGASQSSAEMTRAYKRVNKYWRRTAKGEVMDVTKVDDPNIRDLFERLQNRGILDVGIALDMGSLKQTRTGLGHAMGAAHEKMIRMVRTVELFNRGVTAIAAYELGRRHGIEQGWTEQRAIEHGKAQAIEAIMLSQGDYSGINAPRLISQIPGGRVLTQFRKFQLIQISLLVRTMHSMFKGASPAEKTIARKQMAYLLGMHGMVGGLLGLPAANIIGWALAMRLGDEDEPANAELMARRAIGNKELADLVLRGLPAWAGVDASNRLGMGLTFSIMPFTDITPSRDGAITAMGTLLTGPAGAALAKAAQGVGMLQDGEVALGVGNMLPSMFNNTIKAAVYATEGVETRQGLQALGPEDLSWVDLLTQGLGWPSKTITDRFFALGSLRDVQSHFRNRTSRIKKAYVDAFDRNSQEDMQEAIDEFVRLQRMRRHYKVGNPQSISELMKAPQEQREREQLVVEGVPTRRTNQQFVQDLFE